MKTFGTVKLLAFSTLLFWLSNLTPVFAYARDQGQPLFMCVVGLAVGVIAFFWGFAQLRTKRLMEDIPTSTIRAIAPGLVEITGQVVDWQLKEAPFTLKPCGYFEYEVEQYVSSGKNSHWETILKGDSKTHSFYVKDDTGTVLVKPWDSKVIISDPYVLKTGTFTDVPQNIVDFLQQRNISIRGFFGFEKTLRFTERHFLPGQTLFVMGTCEQSPSPVAIPPEGALKDIAIEKGSRSGDLFILSDESQKQLESSFATQAFFGIFGGLTLIGGCLWAILHLLGYM
jgi:hypothetical protein